MYGSGEASWHEFLFLCLVSQTVLRQSIQVFDGFFNISIRTAFWPLQNSQHPMHHHTLLARGVWAVQGTMMVSKNRFYAHHSMEWHGLLHAGEVRVFWLLPCMLVMHTQSALHEVNQHNWLQSWLLMIQILELVFLWLVSCLSFEHWLASG